MIRAVSALVLALCSVWFCCEPAFAAKRIALVIGNSVYEQVPQLQNPVQDATAMSQMFKAAAFDAVTLKLDLKASEMRRALRDFSDDARDADIAIIYFAGHGLEIQGTNYLIPVDAVLERDIDAFDEAVPLDRLLHAMEPARQLRLVILDACRDNPFAKSMKHGSASHLVDRGLARIEQGGLASVGPTSLNTLVAFAAKAGSTAADGDARNSPFTAALIKFLPTPGLDLRKAFGFVRDEVLKVTHNQQEPFIYGSLGGNDVPLVPEPPAPQVAPDTAARDDYELASGINVVATWDSFIRKYPTGFYSDLAKAQRERLIAAKAAEDAARRAVAQKLAEEAGAAAEAERQRLAAKAIQEAKAAELARAEAAQKISDEAAKAAVAREADERQKALAEAAEAARRAAAQKRAEEAAAAEAERQRLAVEAIEKVKAAELARAEAAKKASDEAAKAAVAREADERQKALAEAAEAARRAAAKKLADEAAAAEAERQRIAASQEAKTAEIAHVEAEAKADGQVKLAALLPGNPAPGQESDSDASTAAHAGCADVSPELASLSPDTARTLSLSEECGLKPKQSFKECENCPEMVVVPAGEFLMGSSKEEISKRLAAANEGPQHKVVLTQMIAVGRFEVTRDQYAAFVDATGHQGSGRCFTLEQNMPQERENRSFLMPGYAQQGNHPAVCVSWSDAQAYVDWLARITGRSYRLPSEAEYEYAARAGGTARYGASDDTTELCRFANGADQSARAAGLPDDADYMDCTDGFPYTAPVGSFAQNAFGLNDLIGNVWEWTADCFAEDYRAAPSDAVARGQADCPARAVRGGDWFSAAALLRPAVRASAKPDSHYDDIGFRVVRTLAH